MSAPTKAINPSELPTIRGLQGASDYLNALGIEVTPTLVKAAVYKNKLWSFKLGNKLFFSESDLLAWVTGERV